MRIGERDHQQRSDHLRGQRFPLGEYQSAIEREGMRLRAEIGVSEFGCLELETAITCIPNCELLALRHIPGITMGDLVHARTDGYHSFGALAGRKGSKVRIVFNDARHPLVIRVDVMEELFHLRLGHKPDIVSRVPKNGRYRTYDGDRERQASNCGIAALVPYYGLRKMLLNQHHIARIAEHFAVLIEVVQERIAVTNLGELINMQRREAAIEGEVSRSASAITSGA